MANGIVIIRCVDGSGEDLPAEADVTRCGSVERNVKAGLFITGGILGGAACIIIPVLHLITTWGLPLLGIVAGLRAARTEAHVRNVRGRCPSCDAELQLNGGAMTGAPLHDSCPACRAGLEIVLADEEEQPATPGDV